jgi:SurA N-terminal domain
MIPRRTAGRGRLFAAGAAMLGLALGVGGCASSPPGAAAVVGSTRIEQATVGEQMRSVNELTGRPAEEASPELARTIVSYDVGYELVEQTAQQLQTVVPQATLDQVYSQQVSRLGGEQQLQEAAAQQGIAPGNLRRDLKTQLLVTAIANKVAPGLAQDQQQARLVEAIAAVAAQIGVDVAPKYGQWDPQTLQITAPSDPVSRPQSSAASVLPAQ